MRLSLVCIISCCAVVTMCVCGNVSEYSQGIILPSKHTNASSTVESNNKEVSSPDVFYAATVLGRVTGPWLFTLNHDFGGSGGCWFLADFVYCPCFMEMGIKKKLSNPMEGGGWFG